MATRGHSLLPDSWLPLFCTDARDNLKYTQMRNEGDQVMGDEERRDDTNKAENSAKTNSRRRSGWSSIAWAVAVVAVVLILTAGYVISRMVSASSEVQNTLGNVFRPNVKIERVVSNTIGELKKESKLVVMTAEITVFEKRSSTKRILWDYLDLGTTVVEVRVRGNKAQYVIPTEAITKDAFRWDAERGEMVIEVPEPVVDEEIVEIQSDPSKIEVRKDVGWGRFESRSGAELERQIRRDLRPLVIEEANNDLLLERARKNAEEAVRALFEKFKREDDVEIPARFHVN